MADTPEWLSAFRVGLTDIPWDQVGGRKGPLRINSAKRATTITLSQLTIDRINSAIKQAERYAQSLCHHDMSTTRPEQSSKVLQSWREFQRQFAGQHALFLALNSAFRKMYQAQYAQIKGSQQNDKGLG